MEEIIVDACQDIPSKLDWEYEDMFGSVVEGSIQPSYVSKNTPVQNQNESNNPSTHYACTCYGLSHICNEQNFIEKSGVETLGQNLWKKALERGALIKGGRTLQGGLELVRDENLVEGYVKVTTIDSIKRCIRENKFIYTGTNRCDWDATLKKNNVFQIGSGLGHCFCIIGYDDTNKRLVAKNSFGAGYNDKGYFYIPYTNIGDLFTKYAVLDKENKVLVSNFKKMTDQEYIHKAIEAGIMNGKELDKPLTREQMAIIIGRLLQLLAK